VACKKNGAAPIALTEDLPQLAASPLLLEFILASLCSPEKPTTPVTALKKKVDAKLKKPFENAIKRQIQENSLPPTVECLTIKKVQHLHPRGLRLLPEPEEVLADKLLQVLEAQRRLGEDAYPLSMQRLIELASPETPPALVNKALAIPTLREKLVLVDAKVREAPVALVQDRVQLLSSAALLEFLLRTKRKPTERAFPAERLVSKKSDFHQPFLDSLQQRIEAGSLPPTIGWIWVGKKKHIFFLEDVHGYQRSTDHRAPPASSPAPVSPSSRRETPVDFAHAFDEAFNQINRQKGAHNFVNLVELRRVLPLPRECFDAELRKLRIAGRYTLSTAEGRHGISPEERAAGIFEDGSLLLYVSRKAP
jgi:hypothetical protein